MTVCRRDTPEQQECTTSTADAAGEVSHNTSSSATNTSQPELSQSELSQPASHERHDAQQAMHQLPSSSSNNHTAGNSPDAALAESELMAENVPEAVQRLTSTDATTSSSSALQQDPVLTSPTSLALPAADAYRHMALPKDDDSDSEYGLEFNPYSFVKSLPPLSSVVPPHLKTLLPPQTRRCPRKTLVLDLDETLVRCNACVTDLACGLCWLGMCWRMQHYWHHWYSTAHDLHCIASNCSCVHGRSVTRALG